LPVQGTLSMLPLPARLCFPPFEFDLATGTLWQGTRSYRLKPQAAAVLRYLVEHTGQVVSKDELLTALWPDVRVGVGVLKTCLWEIRQALRDQPQAPRFIETLPRRGIALSVHSTAMCTPATVDSPRCSP